MKLYSKLFLSLLLISISFSINAQQRIQVLSAVVKDKKIEGAEVLIQKNGEQTVVGRTDSNGYVTLSPAFADDQNATIIIKKDGYSTLVAKCPCQGLTYAISPVMSNLDGVRIVLSWGRNPDDLDSHLWYQSQHVYYNKKESPNAILDVDDTDGYGPETITIQEKQFGKEYVYGVYDYSNKERNSSEALSASGAKVFVYIGQSLVKTYYVPQNKTGNLWTVFKITASGDIEDINSFTTVVSSSGDEIRYNTSQSAVINYSNNNQEALRYNKMGTEAYNAKNYNQAIEYYVKAIGYDSNFGQAYGNLGLTYQKAGMYAEALWANRKAIALANGATASTTRAGAYYNIGKIYEECGEYRKALEQYKLAKSEKANTVYDNAIARMQSKL